MVELLAINDIEWDRAALDSVARRPTQCKIVLRAGATIGVRLVTYIIDSSRHISLIQVKARAHCSEGHLIVSVSCLQSAVHWVTSLAVCQPSL